MPNDPDNAGPDSHMGAVLAGPTDARPAPEGRGRCYLATDSGERFRETETEWELLPIDAPEGRFEAVRTETAITARRPAYDVRAWGAIGDGESDDTTAIQRALDAAREAGGGVVRLPPGTYRTSWTLLYGSHTVVRGQGATIAFDPETEDATALVSRGFDGSGTTRDVTISGLDVKSVDPEKGNGIGVAKAARVTVEGCRSEALHWHLVDVAGAKDVVVRDCYAANLATAAYQADNLTESGGLVVEHPDGTTETAIPDDTENENVDIESNIAEDCGRGVHLHRSGGHDLTVRENKFRRCTGTGILGDADTRWHDVIVADNIVEGNGESNGIDLQGEYTNLSIEDNTVRRHERGITVQPGENAGGRPDEDGNANDEPTTADGSRTGIAAGVTVGDNTVAGIARTAIALGGISGHVSDNYVHGVGDVDPGDERAIHAGDSRKSNRTREQNPRETDELGAEPVGIAVRGCEGITVTDNVLRTVSGTGILVGHGSTDVVVSENNVDGFTVAVALSPDSEATDGVDVKDNRFVGHADSRWAVFAVGGSGVRIEDNAIAGVGRGGVHATAIDDLHVGNNDATGNAAVCGYAIDSCTAVELHDNTATHFDAAVSIEAATGVHGNLSGIDVAVDEHCREVSISFDGAGPPTSGAFDAGSTVENESPSPGGPLGWICIDPGTPGTWKPYGRIDP